MSGTIYLSGIAYYYSSVVLPGQTESGDLYFIKEFPDKALIGVVDGLGHGQEAAVAAKIAIETLELNSELSFISLVKLCHKKLLFTRGAVMALASINYDDETLTWLSIGNVEGMLLHADLQAKPAYENIFKCPGVVGYNLPNLYAKVEPISKGDLLILSTDGIKNDYIVNMASDAHYKYEQSLQSGEWSKEEVINQSLNNKKRPVYSKLQAYSENLVLFKNGIANISPHKVTDHIIKHYVKGTDDALVAVVKFLGKD
jgi:negative regulator of sigma-B (phosphoserine phosphatase)